MKILVPIKQVPETTVKPKIGSDGKSINLANVKMVVNPFDEYAIEEALKTRDAAGEGEVVVVTMGDADSVQALRTALAMGANTAVRIKEEEAEGSDAIAVANIMAGYAKDKSFDLILCGKQAVGDDGAIVPQVMATKLGLPVVTSVFQLDLNDGRAVAHRSIEGKTEVIEIALPAVFSVDKGLNEPRYPKLKGIMAAKKATIEEFAPADVTDAAIGTEANSFELTNIELPPERGDGIIIEVGEEPEAAAQQLVDWLKNDAKVI